MPKILTGVKEAIIRESASIIEKEGPKAFSVKEVAKRCNIGVGTVYNYFPGEISLIDAVMSLYWAKTDAKIQDALARSESFSDSLLAIRNLSEAFVREEIPVFAYFSKGRAYDMSRDHKRFAAPIYGYIRQSCEKFHIETTDIKIKLAGSLLSSFPISQEVPFTEIESAIEKILK